MTEQTTKQIAEAKTIEEKIKAVNQLLHDGEPGNISVDGYSNRTGYKPQYLIDAMNAVFKIGQWGFEEVASEIVTTQTEKGNSSSLAIAQVKVWIKTTDFTPVGYGQSRMPYRILCNGTFQKSQEARSGLGLASSHRTSLHNNRYGVQSRVTKGDIGDAKKGAQTDAIKKALSYFSIGNRAYHGLLKA